MSRIPQSFIDDLLNRLDIVDIIDSRVKLRKAGKDYVACCPFHKEKTPSFSVSQDKQFYYCFGCGATGTALGFVMEYDHTGFIDAVEQLAKMAGLQVPVESAPHSAVDHQKPLFEILEKARLYYEEQLREHPQRKPAINYLKGRGLNGAITRSFGVGYAPPGWDNLLNRLGLTEDDRDRLAKAGMLVSNEETGRLYDRFRHRIMFPILDIRGRTIGFGGRILEQSDAATETGSKRGSGPKYLNSPETPVFHKGRELYGLHQAKRANNRLQRLIVVEGYMDVIALAQFGISCAVATLGTACGEEHLQLAFRHTNEVVFCFDGDNAGRRAARRALENALPVMSDGRQIRFLFLPEGQDPDTLIRQIGADRFEQQLAQALPLEDFFFEAVADSIDLRSMDGRARMSKLASPLLNRLPRGVYRELMFEQLARRTGLAMATLQELVNAPAHLEPPSPSTTEQTPPEVAAGSARPPQDRPSAQPPRMAPRQTGQQILLNPARTATTLLLEEPGLINSPSIDFALPDPMDDPDLQRLARLIQFLQGRTQTTFHSILGYWGGQFGLEAQKELTALVASQFLGTARKSPIYDSQTELKGALQRIRTEIQVRSQERELAELSRLAELTVEQKAKLRELLAAKVRTRLNSFKQ